MQLKSIKLKTNNSETVSNTKINSKINNIINKIKSFINTLKNLNQKQIIFILLGAFNISSWSSPAISLFLGVASTFFIKSAFKNTSKLSKYLLQVSVVGLGFGMNLYNAIKVSQDGFFITFAFIFGTLILGYFLGNLLKIHSNTNTLISSGTAICGGSAIAAVSPVIKANNEDISVSMGIVFLLNSVALLIFPLIGHYFNLSQYQFGVWSAIAIHDTSSVVGAAGAFGDEALQIATTIKLARALWIIPITLLFAYIYQKIQAKNDKLETTSLENKDNKTKSAPFPKFVLYFIAAMALNTFLPYITDISPYLVDISKKGLNLTLFLIGAGLSIENIRKVGLRAVIFGIILWLIVLTTSLFIVLKYY